MMKHSLPVGPTATALLLLVGGAVLSTRAHYGNPLPGGSGCTPDEVVLTTMAGDVCAPHCAFDPCPTDIPPNVTAKPVRLASHLLSRLRDACYVFGRLCTCVPARQAVRACWHLVRCAYTSTHTIQHTHSTQQHTRLSLCNILCMPLYNHPTIDLPTTETGVCPGIRTDINAALLRVGLQGQHWVSAGCSRCHIHLMVDGEDVRISHLPS